MHKEFFLSLKIFLMLKAILPEIYVRYQLSCSICLVYDVFASFTFILPVALDFDMCLVTGIYLDFAFAVLLNLVWQSLRLNWSI